MPVVSFQLTPLAVIRFEGLGRSAVRLLVVFVGVSVTSACLQDEVVSLTPYFHIWRVMGLSVVWTLLLDLSGLGCPARGVNPPASIALGVTGMHRPLNHVKAQSQ